jgi:hypothetical protein
VLHSIDLQRGHTGPVSALTALVLPDGRPVAVAASGDGMDRVWDLRASRCTHVLPFTDRVERLAAVVVDGQPCVIAVDDGVTALQL